MYKIEYRPGFYAPTGISADRAAGELDRIRNERGELTPDTVVDESKHETAVLHTYFTWDDALAAAAFRRGQASKLIRSIVLVKEGQEEGRNMYVLTMKVNQRQYMPVIEVQKDPDMLEYALRMLISQLKGLERSISDLMEKPLSKSQASKAKQVQKHISRAATAAGKI